MEWPRPRSGPSRFWRSVRIERGARHASRGETRYTGSVTPLLVTDFDGTLTDADIGNALCRRFADSSWETINGRWHRKDLGLAEAQRQMWGLVDASREELLAEAHAVGSFRRGADQLFEAAQRGELRLVIVSGGFDLYIDALLGGAKEFVDETYCNHLRVVDRRSIPEFPPNLSCGLCAICKRIVLERLREAHTGPVYFCGDGTSDRCAAGIADRTFVVRGSYFEKHCNASSVSYVPFTEFRTVLSSIL